VTISGNNLCGVSAVHFGTISSHFTIINLPVCSVSTVSPRGIGVVDVTVTGPGGTSPTGPQDQFSYAPEITSISPAFGPTAGRTTVTISGNNLCGVSAVHFGTISQSPGNVTQLASGACTVTARSPNGTGMVDVTVTGPGGTSPTGPKDQFSYQ
jgi:hypothetical protein